MTPAVALVAELASEVLGPGWLDEINRRHRAAGRPEIVALDERAALALLASEPEFRERIGGEWQARARQLNTILSAAIHNNQRGTWRDGDAQRALRLSAEIKTFLERRAAPVPARAPQHHDRPYEPPPESSKGVPDRPSQPSAIDHGNTLVIVGVIGGVLLPIVGVVAAVMLFRQHRSRQGWMVVGALLVGLVLFLMWA